jgi:hypothetical protein
MKWPRISSDAPTWNGIYAVNIECGEAKLSLRTMKRASTVEAQQSM